MIRNKKRSKIPFILLGVIAVSGGALAFLQYKGMIDLKINNNKVIEEYVPGSHLSETQQTEFTYKKTEDLNLAYTLQDVPYIISVPKAEYNEIGNGIGAQILESQYIYIGTYESNTDALSTALNYLPLVLSEDYNRNGSHADTKLVANGYIYSYETEYTFTNIVAAYNTGNNSYYAAIYGIDIPNTDKDLIIASFTTGTTDASKDLCLNWIDTLAASITYNSEFVPLVNVADADDGKDKPDTTYTGSSEDFLITIPEIEVPDTEVEYTENTESTETGNAPAGNNQTGNSNNQTGNSSGQTGNQGNSQGNNQGSGSNTSQGGNQGQTETPTQNPTPTTPTTPPAETPTTPSNPTPPPAETPTTPTTPQYNGAADTSSMTIACPFEGYPIVIRVTSANSVPEATCTITAPDGSVVGGWTAYCTSQAGTYTITVTYATRIGQVTASLESA